MNAVTTNVSFSDVDVPHWTKAIGRTKGRFDEIVSKDHSMEKLAKELFEEIRKIPLIDPHSHIDPHAPVAKTVNDLLAYHYYTELAHSAGLAKSKIENCEGFEQAENIVGHLSHCSNTVQYGWLMELCRTFFGFEHAELTPSNLSSLFEGAESKMASPDWEDQVFRITNLESIFLTNDFDDPLEGFDTDRYIPCLRTDDLVFGFGQPEVRERLAKATSVTPTNWQDLNSALDTLFDHFVAKGARACAISLPPDFEPVRPGDEETRTALDRTLGGSASDDDRRTLGYAIFYALADRCEEFHLPFDLMVGVWRKVYKAGVFQGQDLFEKTTSLYQYRRLFNEKSKVIFPISVLTHNQNQELASYAWIFPNVLANGHWWYSNVPVYLEADMRARLEAVPKNKQIGYYSDAYKLEFVLPKYKMYRLCLARVLARDFVIGRGFSEEKALDLARTILRDNVERIFPSRR